MTEHATSSTTLRAVPRRSATPSPTRTGPRRCAPGSGRLGSDRRAAEMAAGSLATAVTRWSRRLGMQLRPVARRPPAAAPATPVTLAASTPPTAGLAALTMRTVAAELGTGGGSLYRHVTGRDELSTSWSTTSRASTSCPCRPAAGWPTSSPRGAGRCDPPAAPLALRRRRHSRRRSQRPGVIEHVHDPARRPSGERRPEARRLRDDERPHDGLCQVPARRAGPGTRPGPGGIRRRLVAAGRLPHLAALRPEAAVNPDEVFRDMVRRVLRGPLMQ